MEMMWKGSIVTHLVSFTVTVSFYLKIDPVSFSSSTYRSNDRSYPRRYQSHVTFSLPSLGLRLEGNRR